MSREVTEIGPNTQTPAIKWINYPSLRLGIGKSKGKGRIQTQLRRAFITHGDVISSTQAYQWCKRHQSSAFGQWERWSITRVLMTMADRVGHSRGPGRPWIWRLRNSQLPADTRQATDIAKDKADAE
jgi:hypothetical protein